MLHFTLPPRACMHWPMPQTKKERMSPRKRFRRCPFISSVAGLNDFQYRILCLLYHRYLHATRNEFALACSFGAKNAHQCWIASIYRYFPTYLPLTLGKHSLHPFFQRIFYALFFKSCFYCVQCAIFLRTEGTVLKGATLKHRLG